MTLLPLTEPVAFKVAGIPIPQGSKNGYVIKGRVRLVDANDKTLRPWRKKVTAAAIDATRYQDNVLSGPVQVHLIFTFDRPASHLLSNGGLRRGAPRAATGHGLGDIDKLIRAIFDAITNAKVWLDDSQVVEVRARKYYASEHELALPHAGVRIQIQEMT